MAQYAKVPKKQVILNAWANIHPLALGCFQPHDLHPVLAEDIVARGAARAGLTWHYARPPVENLDYEMDVRGVACERVV